MKTHPLHIRNTSNIFFCVGLATLALTASADDKQPPLMQVPAGNYIAWNAPATGHMIYTCQVILTDGTKHGWKITSASAVLSDKAGSLSGTYHSPPDTWKSADGSALTGMEMVRAPSGVNTLYDQLVLANPSTGAGLLAGVTYIQRLVNAGGLPATPCTSSNVGTQEKVAYQANYVFWKPN